MAEDEASIPAKYLDDITECPICTEVYTDPRVLPCIHTYCLKCLTTWGKDKLRGEKVACPLCMKDVEIPAGGFNELPKNFFVQKLIDAKSLSGSQSSRVKLCDICNCNDGSKAVDAMKATVIAHTAVTTCVNSVLYITQNWGVDFTQVN
jgi:hypothetical protein